MRHSRHRSVGSWLASIAMAAAAASGLSVALAAGAAATTPDVIYVIPSSGASISDVVEGSAISDAPVVVGEFVDSGNPTGGAPEAECSATRYSATINWGDGSTSPGTVSCHGLITVTIPGTSAQVQIEAFDVKGNHTYEDSDSGGEGTQDPAPAESNSYKISLAITDTGDTPHTTGSGNSDTASITDDTLSVDKANGGGEGGNQFTAAEGQPVEIKVAVFDNNGSFPSEEMGTIDPGLSATVNWGDGSTSKPSVVAFPTDNSQSSFCSQDLCGGDAFVDSTHPYDARATAYPITVTVADDGGSSVSQRFTAVVTDAALTAGTAKVLSATATKASTQAVASFADAAGSQASVADFAASINWGDNTTSSGSVSQTAAGAFSVSGTHAYASTGTKTLTVTVTDEEGKTAIMTASVSVGAAPVILPATGQAHQPSTPAWPLLYLALLILGSAIVGAGVIGARSRKA